MSKLGLTHIVNAYTSKLLNAITQGIEISLSGEDLKELANQDKCAYSGKSFVQGHTQLKPTFERINPNLGYVSGNVVIVTRAANGQKACLDQFVKVNEITDEMEIKLLRKALYQLELKVKKNSLT